MSDDRRSFIKPMMILASNAIVALNLIALLAVTTFLIKYPALIEQNHQDYLHDKAQAGKEGLVDVSKTDSNHITLLRDQNHGLVMGIAACGTVFFANTIVFWFISRNAKNQSLK